MKHMAGGCRMRGLLLAAVIGGCSCGSEVDVDAGADAAADGPREVSIDAPDAPDANEDSSMLPPGVTVSPDGAGYCCPIGPRYDCDCANLGGFAPMPTACGCVHDARPPDERVVDAHGCEQILARGSCLPSGLDAGEDAGLDSETEHDAGEDASD